MKTIQIIITVGILGFTSSAFSQNAPKEVTDAFSAKYSSAKDIKWELEDGRIWEVEFKLNSTEYSAEYTTSGEWLQTENEIKIEALPENIKKTIKSDFSGFEIEEAEQVETPHYKGYEVELEKGDHKVEVVYDETGKIMKKTSKTEE